MRAFAAALLGFAAGLAWPQVWTRMPSGTSGNQTLNDVHFTSPTTGYVTGYVVNGFQVNGTLRKTTDGGMTWRVLNSGTTQPLFSVFFVDANTGWVAGDSGTILKTTNGGSAWGCKTAALHGTSTTSFLRNGIRAIRLEVETVFS